MNKNTTVLHQAKPALSACLLHVGSASGSVCHPCFTFPCLTATCCFGLLKGDIRQCKPHWFPGEGRADSISHHALRFLGGEEKSCCAVGETAWSTAQAHKNNRLDLETGWTGQRIWINLHVIWEDLGTYSFYSHRLLWEMNTAVHLWQHNISTVITMIAHCFLNNYYS